MAGHFRIIAFALVLALACPLAFPSSCLDSPVVLPSKASSYPAAGIIGREEGTVSAWMYLQEGGLRSLSVFQTDDERFSMFIDTSRWQGRPYLGPRIVARAGGNKPASWGDSESYPEAYIVVSEDELLSPSRFGWYSEVRFPEGQWHLVTMKWKGSPGGNVSIFFDGKLAGSKAYSGVHSDGQGPFSSLQAGVLPNNGVEIGNISFYPCALDGYEILQLASAGKGGNGASSPSLPSSQLGSVGASGTPGAAGSPVQASQRVVSSTEFYSDGKKYLNVTSIRTVHIFYGLIPIEVEVQSKVDAETSETVEQALPWWYFIVAD